MSELLRSTCRLLMPVAVTAAGVLALASCGGTSGPSQQELEEMIAPDGASASAADDGPDVSEFRFTAESVSCEPRMNSGTAGSWETSAPRSTVSGDSADIGLRNTEGSGKTTVTVSVLTPDETQHEATAEVSGEDWASVAFPADFEGGPDSLANGTYTIVWSTAEDDGGSFISCDGFTAD